MKVVLDEGAKLPVKAHMWDAGYDLFAKEDFTVYRKGDAPFQTGYAIHDTGVHIEIPKGYVGLLKSKSGLNVKHDLTGEGVIDSGYTGPIVVKLYNHGNTDHVFKKGDKIIQLVIVPIFIDELIEVKELSISERGNQGFGSSGN